LATPLKNLIRPLLPRAAINLWRASKAARIDARFARQSPAEVFSAVYRDRLWSAGDLADFSSGAGSHAEQVVRPYVDAVRAFLSDLPGKPDVVDLGCGDFCVGARLRDAAAGFIACDVVAELIERNRKMFAPLDVDFRCLDIVADPLPPGDVVFLRQVLQHLSNAQVGAVLGKLHAYSWAVITEHLPKKRGFRANTDKPVGPGTRLRSASGIVVTQAPFQLAVRAEQTLCAIEDDVGLILTVAYRL
jgi:SAM-dependent methyltransferase